jgi:ketosteroid isomerase-like protein
MTLLDHGQPADTPTKKHRTGLIAVLAILAVTLLAAGAWLFVDRQQPLSTEQTPSSTEQQPQFTEQQAAIMDVVTAHNDATNARDRDALQATITDDFTWGSIPADDYVAIVATKGADDTETFTGDPVFSGDLQVAIPTHREPGGVWEDGTPVVMDGTYTFTLREVDGQLKIATIVFAETSVNLPGASSGSTS